MAQSVPTRQGGSNNMKRGRWHYKPGVWHARQGARVFERAEAGQAPPLDPAGS